MYIGRVAEWLKAGVCKTLGLFPRRFESGLVLEKFWRLYEKGNIRLWE